MPPRYRPLPEDLSAAMNLASKSALTALHIFDFDSTLVRTLLPEEGAAAYLASSGSPWPHKGWWGREESLGLHVMPFPTPVSRIVTTVFSEYEEIARNSSTAAAVVVTGRLKKLRPAVLRVLRDAAVVHCGEDFVGEDAVFTNPGGPTLEFKCGLMKQFLREGPAAVRKVKEVHIWEDRQEHATHFQGALAVELERDFQVETHVHFVPPEMP